VSDGNTALLNQAPSSDQMIPPSDGWRTYERNHIVVNRNPRLLWRCCIGTIMRSKNRPKISWLISLYPVFLIVWIWCSNRGRDCTLCKYARKPFHFQNAR